MDTAKRTTAEPNTTRILLLCAVIAGPLYVLTALLQIAIRPGFDITRHPLSIMSNGDLGWIQITNFILAGLLIIAGAIGFRRAMRGHKGGTWAPIMLVLYGIGLIGSGIFVAPPMGGFPPELAGQRPAGTNAGMHFLFGAIGFIGLICACLILARHFLQRGVKGWAAFSLITGLYFLAAFIGIASGPPKPFTMIAFWIAVLLGWTWISLTAVFLRIKLRQGLSQRTLP
jgi:hypothetical membrane protein